MGNDPEHSRLEQRIELLESLIKNSQLATIQLTKDNVITEINPAFTRLFGFEADEAVGQHIDALIVPLAYREEAEGLTHQTFNGETIHKITRRRKKDGELKDVEIFAGPLKVKGVVVGSYGQYRDISDQTAIEETLRKNQEQYRQLVNNAEDIIYGTNDQGCLTYVNPIAEKILGYQNDEAVGKHYLEIVRQDYRHDAEKFYGRQFVKKIPNTYYEFPALSKDGKEIWLGQNVQLNMAGDQMLGFQAIARDITEKRKLEGQLQRAQKMEAIGTLAGGVAHDLNNILSGIVSYPDLLLLKLPEDSPLRKPITTIQESGKKAAAIVQDLLTLARRGVATSEVLNLNDIFKAYLKSPEFDKLALYHPWVQVESRLTSDLLNISGSSIHLSKTIMNLISNAAEAMPNGGKIIVSTENKYIDQALEGYENILNGDYVILSISDTGTGISPKDMDKIFEPFYTKKVMGRSGTGLGMAVVWGTVKDHKGSIDVHSKEGEGTTFTLYFPATREKLIQEQARLSIKDYSGNGECILVVDDVKEQREIAVTILSELGYSARAVSSGEDAVEYVQKEPADLLLLDMIMDPGIDGLETYKRVLSVKPGQKVIITSGYSETDRVRETQRLGAGAYFRKPYVMEKIGLAIRKELGGH